MHVRTHTHTHTHVGVRTEYWQDIVANSNDSSSNNVHCPLVCFTQSRMAVEEEEEGGERSKSCAFKTKAMNQRQIGIGARGSAT